MSACIVCNYPLTSDQGKRGRPRTYCEECVSLGLRESDNRTYARSSHYQPEYPESAGEFTADMPKDAVDWRLERLARLANVAEFDRNFLRFKIEHELLPADDGVSVVSVF